MTDSDPDIPVIFLTPDSEFVVEGDEDPYDLSAVPVSELEALVEAWRETLEWAHEHEDVCSNGAIRIGEKYADELQEVLDDYE